MKKMNQANRYIDDYFYYIDSKVIEIHDSDYDGDMEINPTFFSQKRNEKKSPKFYI